jgi:thiol-disulfide isomerase/thioredoxin
MNNQSATRPEKTGIFPLFFVLCIAVCMSGCVANPEIADRNNLPEVAPQNQSDELPLTQPGYEWLAVPMTDAVTGEQVSIGDHILLGTPVVIHTFAIWCPACTLQLSESKVFMEKYPGKAEFIALDVDDSEDLLAIAQHVEKNNFAGTFTAAPKEVTNELVAAFGPTLLLQLPQTIIIVENDIFYLGPGVRTADSLSALIDEIHATLAMLEDME